MALCSSIALLMRSSFSMVSTSADSALLDLADALIVRRLERLEGAHEVVEGECHVVARAARGAVARGLGLDVSNTRVFGTNVLGQMLFAHVILFLGPVFARCNEAMPGPSPVIRVSIVLAKMQMPATSAGMRVRETERIRRERGALRSTLDDQIEELLLIVQHTLVTGEHTVLDMVLEELDLESYPDEIESPR